MRLEYTERQRAFRGEIREWLAANAPRQPLASFDTEAGFAEHRAWERKLFSGRWSAVTWPREMGGRGCDLIEWLIFEEEYWGAGAPLRVNQNGIFLLAPTLFEFGTKEQQDTYLPRMAAVDDLWCQGWSEPDAGSDLAGIKSRAERDDDAGGWRLYGQKTWTTRGGLCNRLFGLFRTDPEAERHRGMTYLLVDLEQGGVTVRPLARLDGDEAAFAEVFFDGAFVPDRDVLGEVNQGWSVAMATTGSERGLTLRSPGRFTASVSRLVALWRERGDRGDPTVRDAVVRAWIDAEAYRLATFETVTRLAGGARMGPESSVNKVFWSEMDVRLNEAALRLLGPDAELDETPWMKGFEFALAGPIYAGTNEIQRNVIAERLLGLPRK
jgi:alkylation response protein AidB-like acyl-CoA dehydrogenase